LTVLVAAMHEPPMTPGARALGRCFLAAWLVAAVARGEALDVGDRCQGPFDTGLHCDDGRSDTVADHCVGDDCRGCAPLADPCLRYRAESSFDSTCGTFIDVGVSCDDGNPCTTGEECHADGCTGGTINDCDDRNPCTQDTCDPAAGCAHEPFPGCWVLSGRTVVTAQAEGELRGQSVVCGPYRCQAADRSVLVLRDGQYLIPSGQPDCPRTPTTIPDEVGVMRRLGRNRFRLVPSNRAAIRRALRRCTGRRLAVHVSQWIKLLPGGRSLFGVQRAQTTVFSTLPIDEVIVTRFDGWLGRVPPLPALKSGMPSCQPSFQLSCRPD
jgi:hypothetical protein